MAENGYTQRDSYMDIGEYRADPETWDILATSKTGDSEFITKTVCNLLQYDGKNVAHDGGNHRGESLKSSLLL